jgi:tRNA G18 (ribose-2'-O)-methylase SpoU
VVPIPMENNVESLNVSVSGAIAMYEWKRQQRK